MLVTPGGQAAINYTCLGLLDPGDEVILLEPFYKSYLNDIYLAGGVPKGVPLVYSPLTQ